MEDVSEAFGFKDMVFSASQSLGVGKSKSHPSVSKVKEIDPLNLAGFCRTLHEHEKSLFKEIWFLFLEDIYRDFTCPAHSLLLGYLNSVHVL